MRANLHRKRDLWPLVGTFRYNVRGDCWEWSDQVAEMHGYEPGSVIPTTDLILAHKHPDDMPTVVEVIEKVRQHKGAFSSRHRIIDTRGEVHVVVVVGDLCYGDGGTLAGASGFYVDITEQFDADVQKGLTEAVRAITARRAVINQAMGMLMLRYGLNADSAFKLLVRLSQESNTKLRILAERVVERSVAHDTFPADVAERIDGLLRTALEGSG